MPAVLKLEVSRAPPLTGVGPHPVKVVGALAGAGPNVTWEITPLLSVVTLVICWTETPVYVSRNPANCVGLDFQFVVWLVSISNRLTRYSPAWGRVLPFWYCPFSLYMFSTSLNVMRL